MKILCDKDEFALLVRECQLSESKNNCSGCLFTGICTQWDGVETIEDLCEIVTEG